MYPVRLAASDRLSIVDGRSDDALLGRGAELETLAARSAEAASGTGQAVILRGPAGIGKSQLVRAATENLPGLVLWAECAESAAGFAVVRELLGEARWSRSSPRADDPQAMGYPVLHGLYWLVVGLMAEGPMTLVIEDAHRCDERSLRWIDFLLRRADNLPLLVLLTQRTGADGPGVELLTQLLGHDRCGVLDLGPLAEHDVADLVEASMDEVPAPAFTRSCAELSGGNPRLLGRLLAELNDRGIRPDNEAANHVAVVAASVLAASALDGLAGQPAHVRTVAVAVAILGAEKPELIAALCGMPVRVARSAMESLRQAKLLDPMTDEVSAVVLGETPGQHSLRAKAALLLNDEGRPAEDVAVHLVLTPVNEPWMLSVLRDAAAEAIRRGAPEVAIRYLRRALATSDQPESDRKRLRIELAGVLTHVDPAAAMPALRELLAETPDPRARVPIAAQFALAAMAVHCAVEATELLVEVLDELNSVLGPRPGAADLDLRTTLESVLLVVGSDEKSTFPLVVERARSLEVPEGNTPAECSILTTMAVLATMECQPVDHAVGLARRALRSPDAVRSVYTLLGTGVVLFLAGEVDAAMSGFARSLADTNLQSDPLMHSLTLSARAMFQREMGELDGATADARAAHDIAERLMSKSGSAMPYVASAAVLADHGDAARAEAMLAGIVREHFDQLVWEWHVYLLVKARIRRQLGDLAGALELSRQCGRSLRESGITNPMYSPWWLDAVDVLMELGDTAGAAELADQVRDDVRKWPTPRANGLALLVTGVVESGRQSVDMLTESIEVLDGCSARPERIRAGYHLGRVLLLRGDVKGARKHLREAMDVATGCSSHALGTVTRDLLIAAGGRVRKSTQHAPDALTRSERRVVDMASAGLSNREIAETLFVGVRTVEVHLTSAYRKLGVSGRTELADTLRGER